MTDVKAPYHVQLPLGPLTTLSGASEANMDEFEQAIWYETLFTMIEDAHLAGQDKLMEWAGQTMLDTSTTPDGKTVEAARFYLLAAGDVFDEDHDEQCRRQRLALAVELGLLS